MPARWDLTAAQVTSSCRDQSGQEAAGAADFWLLYPAMCVHDAVAHGQPNDEIADHQQHRAKSDVQGEDVHSETVVPARAEEMEPERLGPWTRPDMPEECAEWLTWSHATTRPIVLCPAA